MPSNFTENYNLNQWAKSDRVLMEDFNADNAKIDAALKAEADARAAADAAHQSLLEQHSAALDGAVKFASGYYTGDGKTSQTISLDFTPKAVLVFPASGTLQVSNTVAGTVTGRTGLAVTGSSASSVAAIITGGFKVYSGANQSSSKYNYIALA